MELSEEDARVVKLLRTPGVSIKYLDGETRERIRVFMQRQHIENGVSLSDIATKLIGNKTSGYTSWLCKQVGVQARPFEEARLDGIHKKVRKYQRIPFNGSDEDRAYLLGLKHGDLSASRPFGDAIRVSTSTTHPAMIALFRKLFEPYGHVYQHPRKKKELQGYEWNLSVILDGSFAFLLRTFPESKPWVDESEDRLFEYLSGFVDADGSIVTTVDKYGKVSLNVDYNNSDRAILEWIRQNAISQGYLASIRLNKGRGTKTKKFGIIHREDYWQLSIYSKKDIRRLIAKLKPRHPEKVRRKIIALSTTDGQEYGSVAESIRMLRAEIKTERDRCVEEAEEAFKTKHVRIEPPSN